MGKGRRGKSGRAEDVAAGTIEPGGQPVSDSAKKQVRYEDINRAVKLEEVESVKKVAEQYGLWRFVEASEHAGFSI